MAVPPDKAILSATIVTLGSTVSASLLPKDHGGHGELPRPQLLIGTALMFAGLSIMSDFAPKIAVPLAASVAITALTYYGLPILDTYFGDKALPGTTGNTPGPNGQSRPG